MDEPKLDLAVPRYRLPSSGWILTAIGTSIAAFLMLFPNAIRLVPELRIFALVLLVFFPAICVFIWILSCRMICFWRRGKAYDKIVIRINALTVELQNSYELAEQLINERQAKRALQIKNCYCDNGHACLSLYLKRGFALEVGDQIDVIDQENSKSMGKFEIVERKPDIYVARHTKNIDAVWFGSMMENGAAPCPPPTNTIAIKFQTNETENA